MPRQDLSEWKQRSGFPNCSTFSLRRSKGAPAGTKAEMSEDEERCLPRLKGRQCHLETFCDRIWVFFPPANVTVEQKCTSDPHSKRFQVVHLKPVCSLYPTGRCFHLPVFKCVFIRSVSALTSLKSSGQSENTHFLQTRVRWGLAQMRTSHSFHRLMRI